MWNTNKVRTLLVKNKHRQRKRPTESESLRKGVRLKGLGSKWEIKEAREWRTEENERTEAPSLSILRVLAVCVVRFVLSLFPHCFCAPTHWERSNKRTDEREMQKRPAHYPECTEHVEKHGVWSLRVQHITSSEK